MQPVKEELRHFIIDNFVFDDRFELADTESFLASGIIDSIGILQLITFLELRYGVVLEDGELVPENLDSIANVANLVSRKLNGKRNGAVTEPM